MVGAADCRSAGPWFNSGWKSWFTFLTGYDKLTNQIIQMFNNMSPIRTVITTITRKSVNMVAELDNDTAPSRILDTSGQRLEDYSGTVSQGCYGDCSEVGHKGSCSTRNSCSTEERTRPISTVQDQSQDSSRFSLSDHIQATERIRNRHRGENRIPGRLAERESLDRLWNLHSVLPCRLKSNTFDLTTRTSWSPTPQI